MEQTRTKHETPQTANGQTANKTMQKKQKNFYLIDTALSTSQS